MKYQKTLVNIMAVITFASGAILGMTLFGLAAWGDLEAFLFDTSFTQEGRMKLSCPVMISDQENGTVSLTLKNTTEKPIVNRVKAHFSQGYLTLMEEYFEKVQLEPREKTKLEWQVRPTNAAYGELLVLAKVRTQPTYPLVDREGSCGILVVDLFNLTGTQITSAAFVLSTFFMAASAVVWSVLNKPLRGRNLNIFHAMLTLGVLVIAGIITGFLGLWLLSAVILVVAFIVILSTAASMIIHS